MTKTNKAPTAAPANAVDPASQNVGAATETAAALPAPQFAQESVTAAEVPAIPEAAPSPKTFSPVFTHRIAGTPEHGFYRAGRHWPREGLPVHRDAFTDEQWDALEAEPRLVVKAL